MVYSKDFYEGCVLDEAPIEDVVVAWGISFGERQMEEIKKGAYFAARIVRRRGRGDAAAATWIFRGGSVETGRALRFWTLGPGWDKTLPRICLPFIKQIDTFFAVLAKQGLPITPYSRPRRSLLSPRNPISAVASTEYQRRGRGAAATRLRRLHGI